MDTLFTHFYTWKSHSTYGKPCPYVDNGLIRSKNSTKYLNLGFHNSFSKLRYIWWNTGTCGNVFVHFHLWKTLFHWPQTPSTHGKVVFLWPPELDTAWPINCLSHFAHKFDMCLFQMCLLSLSDTNCMLGSRLTPKPQNYDEFGRPGAHK